MSDHPAPGTFYKLDRTFNSGDVVALNFPMKVRMETPVANGVSLARGPLLFVLKMQVDAKVSDKKLGITTQYSPDFPRWDRTPAGPWNYALALKGPENLDQVKVSVSPVKDFPWTSDSSPVVLTAPARQVPAWTLVQPRGINPPLPLAPLVLADKTEQIQLVPDGATQLRVAVFPSAYATAPDAAGSAGHALVLCP